MRKRMANWARPILDRSPWEATALTKLSGSRNLKKIESENLHNPPPVPQPGAPNPTHRSPFISFALLSKVLRQRLSSFSGTATAVLTVWRAEAVRDEEVSESQWTVGKIDDHKGIINLTKIYVGYKVENERQGEKRMPTNEIYTANDRKSFFPQTAGLIGAAGRSRS